MASTNLARLFLEKVSCTLEDYYGECMEFVDDFGRWLDEQKIDHHHIWIENNREMRLQSDVDYDSWKYHAVVVIDEIVHDPWLSQALQLGEYFQTMFPDQILHVDRFIQEGNIIRQFEEVWDNGTLISGPVKIDETETEIASASACCRV